MNTTLRNVLTLLAAVLTIATAARAEDGPPPGPHDPSGPGDHPEFHGFMLQPAPGAPAGAGGWAVISTTTTPASLRVVTIGLPVGTYTVNVTSKADGSVTSFGTFDVHIPVDPIPVHDPAPDGETDPGDGPEHLHAEASFDFPADYDPANVASVQIADANAVTLLSGDNVPHDGNPGGPDHEHEQFILQPTTDGPADAHGHANIEVQDENGLAAGTATLKIETSGLAEGTYTVNVVSIADGTLTALGTFDVAAPVAGEEGSDTEASLPLPDGLNPADVASVQVADAGGVVLLAGDGGVRGGGVEGRESLHQRVLLQASPDAPAGASGIALIEACNRGGANRAILEIKTTGLDAGTYTATVTSLADGSVTVLGTFDVGATNEGEYDGVEFGNAGPTGDASLSGLPSGFHGIVVRTSTSDGSESGLPFPAGFNPLDVAGLQIANAGGVVMLTGDFSNVGASVGAIFAAKVRITPGAAAPRARGIAAASSTVQRHRMRQSFSLIATHAPASTTLTVKINGNSVGTVRTSRFGRVVMRKLPRGVDVHKITSVKFENKNGATVLSAHF